MRMFAVAIAFVIVLTVGCASPKHSASSGHRELTTYERQIQRRADAEIARIEMRGKRNEQIHNLSRQRQRQMRRLHNARDSGRISDSLWLTIQMTDRNINDAIKDARAAINRDDSAEYVRLFTYIVEQTQELSRVSLSSPEHSANDVKGEDESK